MKRFNLEITLEDDELSVSSENDGFKPLELLGFFAWKQKDIINQIEGKVKPNIVKRTLIKSDAELKEDKDAEGN